MPLTKELRTNLIEGYRVHPTDTGSPEVQVAILSERIQYMTHHLQTHPKDFSSQRGLLQMIGKRRRLLDHLKDQDSNRYQEIIKRLSIRR